MPRISAPNIDIHVRQQTARLLDAASELFRTRGYRGTDMEAIASSIGLARNSLYRYYPSKDHILIACVQRDISPFMAQVRALPEKCPDARERIGAWLDVQIDIATSPVHATLGLMGEIREAAPDLRKEVLALRSATNAVLEDAVGEFLRGKRRDSALLAALISGMVEAAAMQAIRNGGKAGVIKRELRRAVERILDV
jgi:AcrR family transcriptional regulator